MHRYLVTYLFFQIYEEVRVRAKSWVICPFHLKKITGTTLDKLPCIFCHSSTHKSTFLIKSAEMLVCDVFALPNSKLDILSQNLSTIS